MRIKSLRINRGYAFTGETVLSPGRNDSFEEIDHGIKIIRAAGGYELIPWPAVDRVYYEAEPVPVKAAKGARE